MDEFAKLGENIVALCDVDWQSAAGTFQKFPNAKRFKDFRKMLYEMANEIDAVVVATPDHTHAIVSVAAMKLGKHVYCEKPLTRTVYEARVMREVAAKQKVVTQMGNQGSATEGLRRAVELAWAGVVGEIREAHIWFGGGNNPVDRPREEQTPLKGSTGICGWDQHLIAPFTPLTFAVRGATGALLALAFWATLDATPLTWLSEPCDWTCFGTRRSSAHFVLLSE